MYDLSSHRSIRRTFARVAGGVLALVLVFGCVIWISRRWGEGPQAQRAAAVDQGREAAVFDYTVTAEVGHIRADGRARFPNGIMLVGTLDNVGSGPIEVKEARVMNHQFAIEFGPDLTIHYYLLGPQAALQPGLYRLRVAFDPVQQSPFAQESLFQAPLIQSSTVRGQNTRTLDPAIMLVSKTFAIGTAEDQRQARLHEQQLHQTIHQQLSTTLRTFLTFWQSLQTEYQQERRKGGFLRTDARASDWQAWKTQWLGDLGALGEQAQLAQAVSLASPYRTTREALVSAQKQLALLPDLYLDVLIGERPARDTDVQRAEQAVQYAFGDALVEMGLPDSVPLVAKVASIKRRLTIVALSANIRSGPGMNYEPIMQVKKDTVVDLLKDDAEWLQIQMGDGRTGWVHHSVVSPAPQDTGSTGGAPSAEVKSANLEKRPHLQLEPIDLVSTPVLLIPAPTSDEVKIYMEVEQQLRAQAGGNAQDRRAAEQRGLQHVAEKQGISPEQIWNTYLKVQGWKVRP